MKIKSLILFPISLVILLTSGCGMPEWTLVIYNATTEELSKELKEYSLPEDYLKNVIAGDTFNNLISQQAGEVVLNVMNGDEVSCESIRLTGDSVICSSKGKISLFEVRDINQIEVFYSDRTFTLIRNSAILGALTSSAGLLGYLPPNPPEPDWKTFTALFGAGFILGIIFDVSSSGYYCLISEKSFIKYLLERQKNNEKSRLTYESN